MFLTRANCRRIMVVSVTTGNQTKGCDDMTNTNMLISKMKLFGDKQEILADALGISLTRTNAKINNTNGAEFTQSEIALIKIRYNLTADEVDQIFLTENDTDKGIV